MLTSWETKKPKRRDFGGNAIVSLQCQFLFDLCQCLAHKGGNPGNGTQYANFFILEYQNHKNPRPDSKSQFTPLQYLEEKTASIGALTSLDFESLLYESDTFAQRNTLLVIIISFFWIKAVQIKIRKIISSREYKMNSLNKTPH